MASTFDNIIVILDNCNSVRFKSAFLSISICFFTFFDIALFCENETSEIRINITMTVLFFIFCVYFIPKT